MRHCTSILLLLFFILAGKVNARDNLDLILKNTHNPIVSTLNAGQQTILEDLFLDEKETSENEICDSGCVQTSFFEQPFLQFTKVQVEIVVPIFQIHINSLLVDLPPPTLS